MNNLTEFAALIAKQWGTRTLADLHEQAAKEATGVVYDGFRVAGGPRLMLFVCVTGKDQIDALRLAFGFAERGVAAEDWHALTLLDVVLRIGWERGFGIEARYDEAGSTVAVVLISAEPRSMTTLQRVFNLPV